MNPLPHAVKTKNPDDVTVFVSNSPSKEYVEVGLIEAQQQSAYSNDDKPAIIRQMREEAGRQGCDGLVVVGANDETRVSGSSYRGTGRVSSVTLHGYRATCIVYQ